MEPIGIQIKGEDYIITHKCRTCGFEKKNKTTKEDNIDAIIKLSANPITR